MRLQGDLPMRGYERMKSVLALFLIGTVTIILTAITIFPNSLLEVFSGSILALLLFQENSEHKNLKGRKKAKK